MEKSISSQFELFNDEIEKESQVESDIQTITKQMQKLVRKMQTTLQQIHLQAANPLKVVEQCMQMGSEFRTLMGNFQQLMKKDYFYKLNFIWNSTLSDAVSVFAICKCLQDFTLLTLEEAQTQMGIAGKNANNNADSFFLDLEVYLFGLCGVPNELARLTTNAVTAGNFELVLKIHQFISEIYTGFRLLNLKNDKLRLRYDSIKYDLKKVEEVVYDLKVRKLIQ